MAFLRRNHKLVASYSAEAMDLTDAISQYTAALNNPNPGIMFEAVDIVVEKYHPKYVIIYGPTAKGYVDDRKVCMVVIVESGNTEALWGDIVWDLAMDGIDGDVTVFTERQFDEYRNDTYSVAYDACKTGFVAYPSDGVLDGA